MVTKTEDFIEITGFEQWTSDPAYNNNGVALNDSKNDGTINMYYTRNKYDLVFVSNVPNSDEPRQEHTESVYYEASLSGYGQKADGSWYYKPDNGIEGYIFVGWYEDETLTTPYTFDGTMPASNVTLFARWEPQRVRIVLVPTPNNLHNDEVMFANEQALTFRLDYKEKIDAANITGNAAKRLGYKLTGWYTTPDFNEDSLWNFETEVYDNVVQTIDGEAFYPVNMNYQDTADWSNNIYKDNPDNKGAVHSEVKGILKLYARWELDIDKNSIYVNYDVPELYWVYDALGNLQTTIPVDDDAYVIDDGKITTAVRQAPGDYATGFIFEGWQLLDPEGNPVEGKVYQPGETQDIPQEYFAEKEMTDDNGAPVLNEDGEPVVMKYVRLRAKFQPVATEEIITKITFNGNGGATTDTHLESYSEYHQVNSDILVMPASDSFEWEGHTLIGWAFDAALTAEEFETIIGGGTVDGKTSTKDDVFLPNATVFADNEDQTLLNSKDNTLYAIWETNTYTVTVKKIVDGTSKGKTFDFTVTAYDDDTLLMDDANDSDTGFTLADGEEKEFVSVPYGTVLTFAETPAVGYSIQSVEAKQTTLPDHTALAEADYIDLDGADRKAYIIKGDTVITYTNTNRTADICLNKVAKGTTTLLPGAEFRLYRKNEQGIYATDENIASTRAETTLTLTDGTLMIEGLPSGDYKLKETNAPAGYIILNYSR